MSVVYITYISLLRLLPISPYKSVSSLSAHISFMSSQTHPISSVSQFIFLISLYFHYVSTHHLLCVSSASHFFLPFCYLLYPFDPVPSVSLSLSLVCLLPQVWKRGKWACRSGSVSVCWSRTWETDGCVWRRQMETSDTSLRPTSRSNDQTRPISFHTHNIFSHTDAHLFVYRHKKNRNKNKLGLWSSWSEQEADSYQLSAVFIKVL